MKGDKGWEKGEGRRMDRGGEKRGRQEIKPKGKKEEKGVEGDRKRSGRRLPPVLPLIDSGTVFCLFGITNAHHTPVI